MTKKGRKKVTDVNVYPPASATTITIVGKLRRARMEKIKIEKRRAQGTRDHRRLIILYYFAM